MDTSKVNQTELSYSCTNVSASVNLYTKRILVKNLDLSVGADKYNISISHIYNSAFSLPATMQTYMGNKWKLNLQQYLYTTDEGKTYIYIDELGMKHNFEKIDDNEYYDTSGLGLTLKLGEEENTISDFAGNQMIFKDECLRQLKTTDGSDIIIEVRDKKIIKVNHNSRPNITLNFYYNSDNLLKEVRVKNLEGPVELVKYYYLGTDNLDTITKTIITEENISKEREEMKFEYILNKLTTISNLIVKEGISIGEDLYGNFNNIKTGYMHFSEHERKYDLNFVGEDLYLGDNIYLGEKEIKNEVTRYVYYSYQNDTFTFGDKYTEVKNKEGITLVYYFDNEGNTISVFEKTYCDDIANYLTSSEASWPKIVGSKNSSEMINSEYFWDGVLSNDFEYTINGEYILEKVNYLCSFLFKTKTTSYDRNITLKLNLLVDNIEETIIYPGYLNTKAGLNWQQVVVPISLEENLTAEELKKKKILKGITINLTSTLNNSCSVADVRFNSASNSKLIFSDGTNEIENKIGISIKYTNLDTSQPVTEEVNEQNYLSEKDLLNTFINRYLKSKITDGNGITSVSIVNRYLLYLNNLTKGIKMENLTIEQNSVSLNLIKEETNEYKRYRMPYYTITKTEDGKYEYKKQGYIYECKDVYGSDSFMECIGYETEIKVENADETYKTYEYYDLTGRLLLKEDLNGIQDLHMYFGTNVMYTNIINNKTNDYNVNQEKAIITTQYNNATTFETTQNGIMLKEEYYEYSGLLKSKSLLKDGSVYFKIEYIYNERNDYLQEIVISDGTALNTKKCTFSYDDEGNMVKVSDSKFEYEYVYDNKELVKVSDLKNNKVLYINNKVKNSNKTTNNITNNGYSVSTTYDEYNRLLCTEDQTNKIVYDYEESKSTKSNARLSSVLMYKNNELDEKVLYTYDEKNLFKNYSDIRKCDRINGETVQICEKEDLLSATLAYTSYDQYSNGDKSEGFKYKWDLTQDDIDGKSRRNGTSVWCEDNDYSTASIGSEYEYDDLGRFYKKHANFKMDCDSSTINKITKERTFLSSSLGSTTIPYIDTYYVTKNVTSDNNDLSQVVKLCQYEYSYENDKISKITRDDFGERSRIYVYDEFNRLKEEEDCFNDKTSIYNYDERGNLESVEVKFGEDNSIIYSNTYDDTNTLNYLTSFSNGKYTDIKYDSYGNCTEYIYAGAKYELEWENNKYLTKISVEGNPLVVYKYDGYGRRISKTSNDGAVTEYFYEGNALLWENRYFEDTVMNLSYIYDKEGVVGMIVYEKKPNQIAAELKHKIYYFLKDALGNVNAITDGESIVATYDYDAWGNHTISGDDTRIGIINPFRYRGYYYDVETNLFLVSSRYYSPELCRWISPDDIEYLDPESVNGLNLYCYCFNNPVMCR